MCVAFGVLLMAVMAYCRQAGGPAGGVFVTDVSNASRTNLMELASLSWHKPTMELFGVDESMLPQIKSNAEMFG